MVSKPSSLWDILDKLSDVYPCALLEPTHSSPLKAQYAFTLPHSYWTKKFS